MSNLLFPHLYGLAWKTKKTFMFKTLVQQSAAPGWETRVSMGSDPVYKFDLSYVVLRKTSLHDELSKLEAFFFARQGQFDSFIVDMGDLTGDTTESSITGQTLTPDANFVAPLVRTKPGTTTAEAIYEAAGVNGNPGSAPVIKKDGVALTAGTDYAIQGPGYSSSGISYGGLVVVLVADPTGHTITADFSWYYRARFAQDETEFELFHQYLWNAQSVQLIGSRV